MGASAEACTPCGYQGYLCLFSIRMETPVVVFRWARSKRSVWRLVSTIAGPEGPLPTWRLARDSALGSSPRFGGVTSIRRGSKSTSSSSLLVTIRRQCQKAAGCEKTADEPCDFIFGPGPRAVLNCGGRQLVQDRIPTDLEVGFYKLQLIIESNSPPLASTLGPSCSIPGLSVRRIRPRLGLKLLCHRAKAPSLKGTGSRLTLENWTMGSIRLM